jgi:sigma-E factor negative regulatory protein RseC
VSSASVIGARGCTARGVVVAAGSGQIEVELEAPPRCEGCHGACAWYRLSCTRRATLATPLAPPVGTTVTVGIADRYLLFAALLVYGLPLAALIGGAVLGSASAGTDLGTVAGAATALAGAVVVARPLRRRLESTMPGSLVVAPSERVE